MNSFKFQNLLFPKSFPSPEYFSVEKFLHARQSRKQCPRPVPLRPVSLFSNFLRNAPEKFLVNEIFKFKNKS